MTAPQTSDNETTQAAPRSTSRGWLMPALLSTVLPVALLLALIFYGVSTDRGSSQLWRLAVWSLQGKLAGQYIGGNLADGVSLRDITYRDAKMQLQIDRIQSRWNWSLRQRKLHLDTLQVGTVQVTLAPTPATPTVLPDSLRLPLSLELNDIRLDKLHLQDGSTVTDLNGLRLHGVSDGVDHTLVLDQLGTDFGQASALLHLNGNSPFAISGGIELAALSPLASADQPQEKIQLTAQLSGSLQTLGIALKASGDQFNGSADIVATPFAAIPLQRASIDLQHLNPRAFNPAAPQADLHVQADLKPLQAPSKEQANATSIDSLRVGGSMQITNANPGSIDAQKLPLRSAQAVVDLGMDTLKLSRLTIALLHEGSITGEGQFQPQEKQGQFDIAVANLDLHAVHQQLKTTRLRGPLTIKLSPQGQDIALQLTDGTYSLTAKSTINADHITLHQAILRAGKASIDLSGSLATTDKMDYTLKAKLIEVDPTMLLHYGKSTSASHQPVAARINMELDASGSLTPELLVNLAFKLHDSSYAQLPMSGSGKLQLQGQRVLPSNIDVLVAGNRVQLQGAFGGKGDRLDVHVNAPQLARLGYGLAGLLMIDGQLTGTLQRPELRASYRAEQLALGEHHLQKLSGQADLQGNPANFTQLTADNKLQLVLDAQGYRGPDAVLKNLSLNLSGTYGSHQLKLHSEGKLANQTLALQFDAHGKLSSHQGRYIWNGSIDKLDNQATPRITLAAPVTLQIGSDSLIAGATRLNVDQMALDLKSLSYQQGKLQSEGHANSIDLAHLQELLKQLAGISLPVKTDLVIDADWNFKLADNASGHFQLKRKSGDMSFLKSSTDAANTPSQPISLGLSELQLRVDLTGQQARLDARIAASRIGTLEAKGQVGLHKQDGIVTLSADAPFSANALLNIPEVSRLAALIGPQYSLTGTLAVNLNANGTLAKPHWSGAINGDQLGVTIYDQGIQLKDGIARIVMDDRQIDLRQIEFHGGSGSLRASGKVQLGNDNPDLNATIVADHLQLFASPDRQLMISGQAKLANVAEQLHIDGKFIVDKALFDLPKSSAPRLSDDVVIVRKNRKTKAGAATAAEKLTAATEKPASRFAPIMQIQVGLGNDFRFNGSGASLRLSGDMQVRSEPYQPLRATGTLQVAEGNYEAFGTKLNIERGLINFQGPISNPNLNILAMRRNQEVEAGVEVTGNANQPRVRLVSEPNVSDDEKLSWIMFGQGSDNAAMSQRNASSQALAFVGNFGAKKIAKDIGLDQFSIGSSESGLRDEQVVNLGKAITKKISLGYEQSLTGAASIAKATWQLSRRWSVVARTGTINGVNILFNQRFD